MGRKALGDRGVVLVVLVDGCLPQSAQTSESGALVNCLLACLLCVSGWSLTFIYFEDFSLDIFTYKVLI